MPPSPRVFLQTVGAGLVRVLYPPRCLGCRTGVDEQEEPLCARCAARLDRPEAEALSARLRRAGTPVADVFALWRFDAHGTVQRLQHALKYGNRPAYGRRLGARLGAVFAAHHPVPEVVVPVPLHRTRLLERGYNQSTALADGIAQVLAVPVVDALARTRPTRSQTRLARDARRANVQGAFTLVQPAAVTGRRVLLVDDVLTTGATLLAAAAVLQAGGTESVAVAALAAAGT